MLDLSIIEKYVKQDKDFLDDEKVKIYQKYYNWLSMNEKEYKDELEYKMVYLLCAYFYYEKKTFLRDSDLLNIDEINNPKFIFKNAYKYLEEIHKKDIDKSKFSVETKNILYIIVNHPQPSLLIARSYCQFYYFKEKMTREYLYFLLTRPTQDDEEICSTIKKLNSYIICKNNKKYKEEALEANIPPMDYFFESIIKPAYYMVRDSDDNAPFSINECDEYHIYNLFKYHYGEYSLCKGDLDYHFYLILSWLYSRNYTDFDFYEEKLEEYFSFCKSDNDTFKRMTGLLAIKKAMKEALKEYKDDSLSYEELALKKICDGATEIEIKECEEELLGFELPIYEIQEKNKNWYENIIQGEYFCKKVTTLCMNDYSLAVASWSMCVESMVYDKLFVNIINSTNKYLKEKLKISKEWKYNKETNKYEYRFTLGTIPWICDCNYSGRNITINDEMIKAICKELEYNKIDDFKKLIKGIFELKNYRNDADHRVPISNNIVEKCRGLVFISTKIIKVLFEEF